jgi:hypothetical protein
MALWLFQWFMPLMLGWNTASHPYFVNVVEIEHNAARKEIGMAVKIFTDDFENTLKSNYKVALDLSDVSKKENSRKYVADYLLKHIKLKVNDQWVTLKFLDYEKENEAIWSYLSVEDITTIKKLEAEVSLLYDYQKEQVNLVQVKLGNTKNNYRLVNPDRSVVFVSNP